MRVLVTGASGFLGSHLAEQLAALGHEVVALVRRTSSTSFLSSLPNVRLSYGSVEDAGSIRAAMEGASAVVHSAGVVKALDPRAFHDVNVEGTRNVLEAAKQAGPELRRFVFVSSLAAVGPSPDGRPVSSGSEPRPVTHYGRSKLAAERLVLELKADLPVVIVRPTWIYGPRDGETVTLFRTVSRRMLPFVGNGRNTVSAVYVTDAAKACILAITADVPSGSAYFLHDGEAYEYLDVLGHIEQAIGTRALLRFGMPIPVMKGAAFASQSFAKLIKKPAMLTLDKLNELIAPHWVCDGEPARRELGWNPEVKWPEGARRTADWYRQQGWL